MAATEKSSRTPHQEPRLINEFVIQLTPFDDREALRLMQARGETLRRLVKKLIPALHLETALDAGCGVGYFSHMLRECGLEVRGFDGRNQNVAEARARFPEIPFEEGDVEDRAIRERGVFDLVLCFGLLYHLENPLLATRNLSPSGRTPAKGICTWCKMATRRLDEELRRLGIERVDFMKLDVEGAELGVLQGGSALLSGVSRPAILAEVQDLRTRPWGYAAREIVRFLAEKGYRWFALDGAGSLVPVSTQQETYNANLVALPTERVREIIVALNEGEYRHHRPTVPASLRWSVMARRERHPAWLTSRSYKSWLPTMSESPEEGEGAAGIS